MGKKEDAQASLRAWLRANIGRKRGQKSGKGLAKALKLHQSQVTQMMKPGGRKVQAHEMPVITAYIGHEPPPEVVSGAFEAGIEAQNGARAVMTPARVRVRIVGTNAPGMWRSQDAEPPQGTISLMDDPDPRLHGLQQSAVWLEPGRSYAIFVDYFELRKRPIHGDEVFVRRTNQAGQVEETIRTVEVSPQGKVRLVLTGQIPRGVDRVVAYPSETPGETVEIVGLVVGTYTKKHF